MQRPQKKTQKTTLLHLQNFHEAPDQARFPVENQPGDEQIRRGETDKKGQKWWTSKLCTVKGTGFNSSWEHCQNFLSTLSPHTSRMFPTTGAHLTIDSCTRTYEAADTHFSNKGKIWSGGNVTRSSAYWFKQRCLWRNILALQTHMGKWSASALSMWQNVVLSSKLQHWTLTLKNGILYQQWGNRVRVQYLNHTPLPLSPLLLTL